MVSCHRNKLSQLGISFFDGKDITESKKRTKAVVDKDKSLKLFYLRGDPTLLVDGLPLASES